MDKKEIEELARRLCKTAFDGEYYGVDYEEVIGYVARQLTEWLEEKGFVIK